MKRIGYDNHSEYEYYDIKDLANIFAITRWKQDLNVVQNRKAIIVTKANSRIKIRL